MQFSLLLYTAWEFIEVYFITVQFMKMQYDAIQ